jgi:hypothetical protein
MPALPSIQNVYSLIAPSSTSNPQIAQRLSNKLNYALSNTRINILVRHREDEPVLQQYPSLCIDLFPFYPGDQFQNGEYGWQDQIVITVQHDFALLPGPARILARRANAPVGSDPTANPSTYVQNGTIQQRTQTLYVYPMSATVRFNNEGERSRMQYVQAVNGNAPVLPANLPTNMPTVMANVSPNGLGTLSNQVGDNASPGIPPCLNCPAQEVKTP